MIQDSAAAAFQSYVPDQRPRQKDLTLVPGSDGKFICSYCSRCYSYRCYEPYKEHLLWKHGCSTEDFRIESPPLGISKPEIKACLDVWYQRGTHYVKVNVLQSFKPGSAIRIEEDVTFTIGEFFQKDFIRTTMYEETVKTIERSCRSIPVEATTSASILEHPSLHAGTNPVQSYCIRLVKWLGSCFLPVQRKPNRWNFPAWHHEPALRRASFCSSEEAIVPDTSHRVDTDISTDINTDRRSSDLNGSMSHHMSTASPSSQRAASDGMLPLSQTTPKHTSCVMNAALPGQITGIIAVGSFHANPEGFCGYEVVVLTISDRVSFLESADFGKLIKCERIARQLRNFVGDSVYHQLLQPQGKHIDIRDPAHRVVLSEVGSQIGIGESLRLEQCHPILQARIRSILGI